MKSLMAAGEEAPAVGIDLGTTYSSVGVWQKNKVEIIANELSNRLTPSYVAFSDVERLIGQAAVNQAAKNPTNTIFDAKRLIGRRFYDESVQSDMKLWPFKVIAKDADKPYVVVNHKGGEKHLTAEEISSMVLSKMKAIASSYLGKDVKKAVVTVPAYFNNSQRQATKDAATIAGLEVIRILDEPTAAAMAFGLDNKESCRGGKKRILVFDLGGGTFDVSILELDGHGVLEVKAKGGDTHLGGQDFDTRMVEFLLKDLQRRYNEDLSKNYKCVKKLKAACESAKRVLSINSMAAIEVECLHNGEDFSCQISRSKFEDLNMDLFNKCMETVEQCLTDAKIEKKSIDEVVLVGGSSRIPKVQEMLKNFFDGKELYKSINADEAVANGASIYAAILNGDKKDPESPKLALLDIANLSLGIEIKGGIMSVVIPKNTRIPCVGNESYVTGDDYQTSVMVPVFEGERKMTADNTLLGEFEVRGIRPAPKGEIKFTCTFSIDADGILTVTARNEDNKEERSITVTRDKFSLNQDDIDSMIRDARIYEHEDTMKKERASQGVISKDDDTHGMIKEAKTNEPEDTMRKDRAAKDVLSKDDDTHRMTEEARSYGPAEMLKKERAADKNRMMKEIRPDQDVEREAGVDPKTKSSKESSCGCVIL